MAGFKQQLYARIPAARWLSTYTWAQARGDTTAGATVGVMLIPQAMAYALLGGVPAVYGLYASLVPLLIYPILGTAPRLAVGIVALDMLAVGAGLAALGPSSPEQAASWAMTVALMVGVIHLGLAALRLDVVFRLMSRPVITGFMVAAPLLIGLSQVSTLLRVDIERSDHVLVNTWRALQKVHVAHAEDVALGVCTMVLLVALRVAWKGFPRALLVTIVSGVLVWWVRPDVALVGALDGQLPGLILPDLSPGLLRDLLPTATTVALLQIISVASLGKSLGSSDEGPPLEPTHELRALGVMNVVGSLFGSVPVSASFSRTAVNASAGAQTPMANAVAALLVAMSILFLADAFAYIPQTTLGAIILVASFGSINLADTRALFSLRRSEGVLALTTTAATLIVGIQEGVLLGVGASLLHLLHHVSQPNVDLMGQGPDQTVCVVTDDNNGSVEPIDRVLILRLGGILSFANMVHIRNRILEHLSERGEDDIDVILLEGSGISAVDSTAIAEMSTLLDALQSSAVALHVTALPPHVRAVFTRSGLSERLNLEHMDRTSMEVLAWVLAHHSSHADQEDSQSAEGESTKTAQ